MSSFGKAIGVYVYVLMFQLQKKAPSPQDGGFILVYIGTMYIRDW